MTPRYPDRQVIRQFIVLRDLIAQARWQKTINLLAFTVVLLLVILAIWFFWPQISVAWGQFLAWRNQVNIR